MLNRMCEREEQLKLNIILDYLQSEKYDKEINILLKNKPKVNKKDSLVLNIDWSINYYDCVKKFESLCTILEDEKIVLNVDLKELKHNHSLYNDLILKVFKQIEYINKLNNVVNV